MEVFKVLSTKFIFRMYRNIYKNVYDSYDPDHKRVLTYRLNDASWFVLLLFPAKLNLDYVFPLRAAKLHSLRDLLE